jgi:tetratricopeptide (TPR) repeat protein
MSLKQPIQTILREIDAYRSHSLFAEAQIRYKQMEKLIRKSDKLKNKEKLLASISERLKTIESEMRKFEEMCDSPQMSPQEKDLVKRWFSYSTEEDPDSATFNAAEALLEFGQFEDALSEFNKLIKSDSLRLVAAKNIIRCHLGLSTLEKTIGQYQQWLSNDRFSVEQLEQIRSFLQAILIKKGISESLPKPKMIAGILITEPPVELCSDIISITISSIASIPDQKKFELDVSYHNGSEINVIVHGFDTALIVLFNIGQRLDNVQFNCHDIIYTDSCIVAEKKQIRLGPKRGDYAVTLKILNV